MFGRYCIDDGTRFRLKDFDPDDTAHFKDKEDAEKETERDIKKLRDLHERFYVDGRRALLVVIQAMDTGGKDGTIKHVFSGVNPAGCQVTSFKAPSSEELRHDFLWRVSKVLPAKGTFGIFNRSHYEDVLIVRVHGLVPKEVWKQRFEHINAFERYLASEGTVIVKFFLHISKAEQKRRLEERLEDDRKHWKFDPADLSERKHWKEYQCAYEDIIRNCSAPWAPWYVVPADHKWFRNFMVARALVDTLSKLDLKCPKALFDPRQIKVK
jgi:PPK2 family polyphosphate:nucleotide phosphotransferase